MSMSIKNNQNLTHFIKKKRVKIISDFEGKISSSLYNKEIYALGINKDDLERFIYCGDIADYTGNLNADDPERYKFLKFIKFINDNSNKFAYVLGNRDLNKLKLLQLLVFKNQSIKWWRGNPDPSVPFDILKISDSLLRSKLDGELEWLVEDLTSFYPYWEYSHKDILEWKGWKSVNLEKQLSLYERFLAIFGVVPKDGTMGAQNTIVGIALELGVLKEEVIAYVAGMKKGVIPIDAANRLAALVFTVFARILDQELVGSNKIWEYDGSLYEYLINGNIVSYAFDGTDETDSTKLYLFSHGGVHSKFKSDLIHNISRREQFWNTVDEKKIEAIISISKQKSQNPTQTGGQIETIQDLINFNENIKKAINNCFEEFKNKYTISNISPNLKFTIATGTICGTFYTDNLEKKVSDRKGVEECKSEHTTIISGYLRLMNDKDKLFIEENKLEIYNIFGHLPVGFGYAFAISQNNSKIISTDYSNSFSISNFTDFNNNSFILVLSNNQFSLEGQIYFDLTHQTEAFEISQKKDPDQDFYVIKGKKEEDVSAFQKLLSKTKKFFIQFNLQNKINFEKQKEIKKQLQLFTQSNLASQNIKPNSNLASQNIKPNLDSNADFNYHGTGKLDAFTVDIFSFMKGKFRKNLILIVSKNPLNNSLRGGKKKSKTHKKIINKFKIHKKKSKYKF